MAPVTASGLPVPQRVAVVGAGMVGLSTAWFLQEHGVEVTVLDREGVAAGSSWGNAGWLTPGIATPLPEPAVLKYGLRAVFSPSSPVYVPPSANPDFLRFVTGFTRHSTMKAWKKAMGALVPVNDLSLESFDLLREGGVQAQTRDAKSFLAAYRTEQERTTLLEEIEHIHSAGQSIEFDVLTGEEARAVEPSLSSEVGAAIRLRDQRFINPGAYVHALADAVRDRGGKILTGATVVDVIETAKGVDVVTAEGSRRVLRLDRAGDRRVARQARARVRRAQGRPGRPRLQLQRGGRACPRRPGLLPGPARCLHARRRPPSRGRDDGVPPPRGRP